MFKPYIYLLAILLLPACTVKTGELYNSSSLPRIGTQAGQIVVYSIPAEGDTTPAFFSLSLNGKDVCQFENYTYAPFNVPPGKNLLKITSDSAKEITVKPGQRTYVRVTLNLPKHQSLSMGQGFGLLGAGIAYIASPHKDESDFFLSELSPGAAKNEVAKTKRLIECGDN